MKFKIDENLPAEAAATLRQFGYVADTVADENLSGSNIRAYPPGEHSGIIVLRLKRQDKATVLSYVRRLATALANRSPLGELWIIDGNRIRFRQGS